MVGGEGGGEQCTSECRMLTSRLSLSGVSVPVMCLCVLVSN